ncbi:type II secretion system protein GspC [Candidatus Sororendozoicomonas aggregata]|uniref:type II secretion system protein GspC n=1 Tax=Candidatus Sororendozoicomonas aggregata TaxID=3073239 RepID=UPI002ED35D31
MLANFQHHTNNARWLARVNPLLRTIKKISGQQWALMATLFLVIILARQLAELTWQLVPQKPVHPHWQATVSSVPGPHSSSYASLNNLHLFGQPPTENIKPQIAPENVSVTRLAAQLTGVVYSAEQSHSLAIIKTQGNDTTYRIGESLEGTRAKVYEIYPDRVILLNNGQLESLLMYPDEENQQPGYSIRPTPQSVKQAIARVRENPALLSDIIQITPALANGALEGYRIAPAKKPELFTQLGLKAGDVAVAINGHDLTNHREAMKIITSLPELNTISLTIEREGKIYQIDIAS